MHGAQRRPPQPRSCRHRAAGRAFPQTVQRSVSVQRSPHPTLQYHGQRPEQGSFCPNVIKERL